MDNLQRDFDISVDDTYSLNSRHFKWETVRNANTMWLIVHGFPVPEGYNVRTVVAAVQIPGDYLMTGLDMVYFKPALYRADGIPIGATQCNETIRNESYQRWSRHRTAQNPWRPGLESIITHLELVEEWLLRELPR